MIKKEQIYEAFKKFDTDKSGKLSLNEIAVGENGAWLETWPYKI